MDALRYFRMLVIACAMIHEAAHIAVAMRSGGVRSEAMVVRKVGTSEASQASCTASWLKSTIDIKRMYLYGFIMPQTRLGS